MAGPTDTPTLAQLQNTIYDVFETLERRTADLREFAEGLHGEDRQILASALDSLAAAQKSLTQVDDVLLFRLFLATCANMAPAELP